MLQKTQTVAWLVLAALVVLIVVVTIQLTTKQTVILANGQTGTITSTNFLKKS
jgi:hypothetical protein